MVCGGAHPLVLMCPRGVLSPVGPIGPDRTPKGLTTAERTHGCESTDGLTGPFGRAANFLEPGTVVCVLRHRSEMS
jgi:hypothetical protein